MDGGWAEWSTWSTCPVTCGNGDQRRTRKCDNPEPEYGGIDCEDNGSEPNETKQCQKDPCPGKGTML